MNGEVYVLCSWWKDSPKGVVLLNLPCKCETMSIKRTSLVAQLVKNPPAMQAGDLDLIPGLGRSIKRTDLFSYLEGGAGGWKGAEDLSK